MNPSASRGGDGALSMAAVVLAAVIAGIAVDPAGARSAAPVAYVKLDAAATQLRRAFNEDLGRVRLVLGVSPTCGSCLRRAATARKHLLEAFRSPGLAAHVVWLPTHGARECHVPEATRLIESDRATHYWDAHGTFMKLWRRPLSDGPGDAEGVVMVYGPEARWRGEAPPVPESWVYEARDVRKLVAPVRRLLGPADR